MKSTEGRIGNLVLIPTNGEWILISKIYKRINAITLFGEFDFSDAETSIVFPAMHCAGIPLTEEWLINFGFEKKTNAGYWKKDMMYFDGPIQIFVDPDSDKLFFGCLSREYDCEQYNDYEIKYVHQLQNICTDLTGEELPIQELQFDS